MGKMHTVERGLIDKIQIPLLGMCTIDIPLLRHMDKMHTVARTYELGRARIVVETMVTEGQFELNDVSFDVRALGGRVSGEANRGIGWN